MRTFIGTCQKPTGRKSRKQMGKRSFRRRSWRHQFADGGCRCRWPGHLYIANAVQRRMSTTRGHRRRRSPTLLKLCRKRSIDRRIDQRSSAPPCRRMMNVSAREIVIALRIFRCWMAFLSEPQLGKGVRIRMYTRKRCYGSCDRRTLAGSLPRIRKFDLRDARNRGRRRAHD